VGILDNSSRGMFGTTSHLMVNPHSGLNLVAVAASCVQMAVVANDETGTKELALELRVGLTPWTSQYVG
jgi:hypothetical protein